MSKFIDNLKKQAEENPVFALGIGAACLTAVSKFLNASTERANSKTWAKEVDRRARKSR